MGELEETDYSPRSFENAAWLEMVERFQEVRLQQGVHQDDI